MRSVQYDFDNINNRLILLKMQMKTKIFFLVFSLLSSLCFPLSVLYAWVEPSDTSNIAAPLNTGSTTQIKIGDLGTNGSLCIKGDCKSAWPNNSLWSQNGSSIYYNGGSVGIGTASPRNDMGWAGALDVNGQIRGTRYYDDDVNYYADLNSGANLGGNWLFNGSVGIGTNPNAKLDVNGYVQVESVNGEGGTIKLMGNNGANLYLENINGTFRVLNSSWTAGTFHVDQGGNISNPGDINMGGGHTFYAPGRMHIFGEENLYLLNRGSIIVSRAWGGTGNLYVEGSLCVGGSCLSNWSDLSLDCYTTDWGPASACAREPEANHPGCNPGYMDVGIASETHSDTGCGHSSINYQKVKTRCCRVTR